MTTNSQLKKDVSGLKVLAVDDNTMMVNLITNMLKDLGFNNIDTAMDGRKGLDKILQAKEVGNPYDIVFLDWNMPEMCGYDVLKECRERLEFSKMAIVMITAENQKRSVLEAMKVGATSYITKPVSKDTLAQKLNQILDWIDQINK